MTREEAKKYGTEWLKDEYLDAKDREFIKIALNALEQEPCDAVSRQSVLDIDFHKLIHTTAKPAEMIRQTIEQLPLVTSQKTGYWIDLFGGCECSECGCLEAGYSDYCPDCGAKMVEPQESEG